jgi:hypothetical protein
MGNNSYYHKKYHKVIAENDKFKDVVEDTPYTFTAADLLENDRDTKGHELEIAHYTQPKHGTLTLVNGTFTYTPDENYYGKDYFKYKVTDEYGKSDWAIVKFKIKDVAETPPNQNPVANDDKYKVKETKKLYGNVSLNDTDPDGTADGDPVDLTFKVLTGPSEGKLYLNEDTGAFWYKPAKDKDRYDDEVTFTYQVTDEGGATDTATVTICIDDNWGKKHYYEKPHYDAMA